MNPDNLIVSDKPITLKLAVLASGEGSNLKSIQQKILSGELRGVKLVLVISNNSQSGALEYAKEQGIAARHISRLSCGGSDEAVASNMLDALKEAGANFIVLAGYMKKLPDAVVDSYKNRILNVHPALLPAFGGKEMFGSRVHEAVLAAGVNETGATVHLVTSEYDAGPIVLQESCNVRSDDTAETLARRIRKIEHHLLPAAIQLFADGRVQIEGNKVTLLPKKEILTE